jgi:hypothetical protein
LIDGDRRNRCDINTVGKIFHERNSDQGLDRRRVQAGDM